MNTLADILSLPSYYLAPVGALAAIVTAKVFAGSVTARTEGDEEQQRIALAVRQGAMAYLRQQYKVVALVFVLLVAALGILSMGLGLQPALSMVGVPIAGLLSGLCGWFGMKMATNASARTAAAAKQSLNGGLTIAFRAGAVLGLNVVGFALLDASVWLLVLTKWGPSLGVSGDLREITTIMLSFAMGASTQALFARVGGGIYTKAADVGADLVGKVEAGIPEDDARNPATIADNVGDNVGDVAGMGADLYESYYGSVLSAAALGAAAAYTVPDLTPGQAAGLALLLVILPLGLAGFGILASIAGIFVVKTRDGATFQDLLNSLNRGIYAASGLIIIASFLLPLYLFSGEGGAVVAMSGLSWLGVGGAIVVGLGSGLVIAKATEYYTSYEHPPTRRIAMQALTGPATVIIGGIAEGMKSTWAALLTTVAAIIAAFILCGGSENYLLGLYGVALAAVGMLATLGITLATDAYGPIADNAGGNAEMSGQPAHVRERTDMLDSLGNTTAAIGKGFAIGSAALTALALFAAYVQIVQTRLHEQLTQGGEAMVASAGMSIPCAVYQGHGTFTIVTGDAAHPNFDGGILVDAGQLPADVRIDELLQRGAVLQLSDGEASHDHEHDHDHAHEEEHDHGHILEGEGRYSLTHSVPHGDHVDSMSITIISTRTASVAEILGYYNVTLTNPRVLGGLFVGTLLTFLFCAMTMSAVGRAAYSMMNECRRQFGLMRQALRSNGVSEADVANPEKWPKRIATESGELPDYATCVAISTAGAQREMIVPSILAIAVPLLAAVTIGVPGVIGLLAGGLASGFAVAIFMANAGGAWDNAKKFIESRGRITASALVHEPSSQAKVPDEIRPALLARAKDMVGAGQGDRYIYGKGSDDHKATVVGDTVGDPFKDTSGPSLNILIKLISIVSVVFAGLAVKFGPVVGDLIGLP